MNNPVKPEYVIFFLGLFLNGTSLAQNVGINNPNPQYSLDVTGSINATSNCFVGGFVGIGTTAPFYKLQVNNGSIASYNTTDSKTWDFHYSSGSNYFALAEDGTNRVVVANGGNVGIGTSTPTAKLAVAGSVQATGDATVDGNLTVSGGKGIIRNSGTSQLKYYTREAGFSAILGGNQLSVEGAVGFSSGIFTNAPAVIVGDMVSTGGTVGELYRVQLVVYGVTTTGCKVRLLNTSPNSVNYNVTWNIVCIGD